MHRPRIAFVTCVHPYYGLPAVTGRRDAAVAALRAAGCEVTCERTPQTAEEAREIARGLEHSGADLLLLFFCTWVAEDVTLALAREVGGLPLLLWALPYLDRDLPMPSPLSGLTASASNIRRLGKPFAHLVGPVDEERIEAVLRVARVAAVIGRLRRARFGLVGAPCPGMLDAACQDADLAGLLGVAPVQLELEELLEAAAQAPGEEAAREARKLISRVGAVEGISVETTAENLRLYLGMRQLIERHRLDACCIRCWPELRDRLATTACLTHARLSEDGVPSACEVDLLALLTTFLLHQLAGTPTFAFDLTAYLEEEGAIQLAHCGAANPALAADPAQTVLRRHMRTGTGVTLEFPFQEGTVTLAKLLRPVEGRLRLFAARGQVLPASAQIRGSVAHVRPEPSAAAFLDTLIRAGVEHHLALVYGDWTAALSRFCDLTGLGLITPQAGVH